MQTGATRIAQENLEGIIMKPKKTGTKEWAEVSKNIIIGCEHDCRYGYCAANAVFYKRLENREDWKKMEINTKQLNKYPRKEEGRIMFPTTHDILPKYIGTILTYLRKWLEEGNEFLIVTKPHLECVKRMCESLEDYKEQIVFRFTITSLDNETLKFWERNAPLFEERFESLKYAFEKGYQTSVSCEPYLDDTIQLLVEKLLPYITDTIWIGKMNQIRRRVDWSGVKRNEQDKWIGVFRKIYSKNYVVDLYEYFQYEPKVKWKDSLKRILGLPEEEGVA